MPIVSEHAGLSPPRFEPSRHAPRSRQVAALVLGPLLWLSALLVVAVVVRRTSAIELGLLIVLGSMVLASIVVGLCRIGRGREERRHAAGG
jgi:hypothetical protein